MTAEKWDLAQRTLVQAFYLNGTMAVFATGPLPLPGYEVCIERLSPSADPAQFAVVQRRLGGIYPEGKTQYAVSGLFAMSSYPRIVVVNHANGKDAVVVVDVRDRGGAIETEIELAPGPGETGSTRIPLPIPYVFPPSAARSSRQKGTATGYSAALDFSEALREAVAGLPPSEGAFPETPHTVRVVEVGIEQGGVANFRHLYVRVRRARSSPAH